MTDDDSGPRLVKAPLGRHWKALIGVAAAALGIGANAIAVGRFIQSQAAKVIAPIVAKELEPVIAAQHASDAVDAERIKKLTASVDELSGKVAKLTTAVSQRRRGAGERVRRQSDE